MLDELGATVRNFSGSIGAMSGGQKQAVAVARAAAWAKRVILLDEPTAELDPAGARILWQLVRELARDGAGVLIATSDIDAIPEFADRVVWLELGRVAAAGASALVADEALCAAELGTTVADTWRAAGLAAPYPATVADAVRRWAAR